MTRFDGCLKALSISSVAKTDIVDVCFSWGAPSVQAIFSLSTCSISTEQFFSEDYLNLLYSCLQSLIVSLFPFSFCFLWSRCFLKCSRNISQQVTALVFNLMIGSGIWDPGSQETQINPEISWSLLVQVRHHHANKKYNQLQESSTTKSSIGNGIGTSPVSAIEIDRGTCLTQCAILDISDVDAS